MDPFIGYVQQRVAVASDDTIEFGPVLFRLVSNVPAFPALQHFSARSRNALHNEEPQFELWCVSLEGSAIEREVLLEHVDRTYRGNSFLHGYYATDHFGPPVYLVTRGQRYYVFGERLELVVWPYFVKYFLMLHSLRDASLHLKAAALAIGRAGTLILGRGGAGKTVFLTQLCRRGARFVTNTHTLVKHGYATGVASAMRIRPDSWLAGLATDGLGSSPAIRPGEVLIDPDKIFDADSGDSIEVRNLCIVDFRGAGCHTIERLSEREAYDYSEQFSLAINVYRLEEDLLDFYGGDYRRFAHAYGEMKSQLNDLVRRSRRYYISCDMLDQNYQNEILDLLSR